MVTPYWVAWVGSKYRFGWGGENSLRTHKHRVLINGISWAVAALEFGRHIAESEFTHIKVGAIEPVWVRVL